MQLLFEKTSEKVVHFRANRFWRVKIIALSVLRQNQILGNGMSVAGHVFEQMPHTGDNLQACADGKRRASFRKALEPAENVRVSLKFCECPKFGVVPVNVAYKPTSAESIVLNRSRPEGGGQQRIDDLVKELTE